MTLIAILTGVLALTMAAASFFAFRASVRSVDHLCSEVRVLVVSVNGLEAALLGEVRTARESADTAVAMLDELSKSAQAPPTPPTDGAPGRMSRMRDIYSALEADSYRMVAGG